MLPKNSFSTIVRRRPQNFTQFRYLNIRNLHIVTLAVHGATNLYPKVLIFEVIPKIELEFGNSTGK